MKGDLQRDGQTSRIGQEVLRQPEASNRGKLLPPGDEETRQERVTGPKEENTPLGAMVMEGTAAHRKAASKLVAMLPQCLPVSSRILLVLPTG